jgi:predicted transcriptional regulator
LTKRKKYRSWSDIIATILKEAVDDANQTKMIYLAYLSYRSKKDYHDVLTGSGVLERNKKTMTHRTTLKGSEFPDKYESMKI